MCVIRRSHPPTHPLVGWLGGEWVPECVGHARTQPRMHRTHPPTHPPTHSLARPLTHPLTHLLTDSLARSPTHSLTLSLTYSLTHSLAHPLTHSLAHSLAHSLTHSPPPLISKFTRPLTSARPRSPHRSTCPCSRTCTPTTRKLPAPSCLHTPTRRWLAQSPNPPPTRPNKEFPHVRSHSPHHSLTHRHARPHHRRHSCRSRRSANPHRSGLGIGPLPPLLCSSPSLYPPVRTDNAVDDAVIDTLKQLEQEILDNLTLRGTRHAVTPRLAASNRPTAPAAAVQTGHNSPPA